MHWSMTTGRASASWMNDGFQCEALEDFAAAGFAVRTVTSFACPVTASLREYHACMTSQPQSKFTQLTAAEFWEGLRRLKADTQVEPMTCPVLVTERYDVVVLPSPERLRSPPGRSALNSRAPPSALRCRHFSVNIHRPVDHQLLP